MSFDNSIEIYFLTDIGAEKIKFHFIEDTKMIKERKTYSERTFTVEIMFEYRNNEIYKINEGMTRLTIRNIIIYATSIVLTMSEIKDIVENIETA